MNLSAHFTLAELTRSTTATRRGLSNEPGLEQIEALKALCVNILEPLRELVGNRPIHINSGYRSLAVNQAVGGSRNSQHMTGEAADLTVDGMTTAQVFDAVRASDLPFDQVIMEGTWLHISYSRNQRRQQCLVAHFKNGGVSYQSVNRRPVIQSVLIAPAPPAPIPTAQPISQPVQAAQAAKLQDGPLPSQSGALWQAPSVPLDTAERPQPSLGQRLGTWVDTMDVSRLVATLSFIATATAGISSTLGELNPKYAAYALFISGTINAFTKKVSGGK